MMRLALPAIMVSAAAAAPTCTQSSCCSAIVHSMCTGNTHAAPATADAAPELLQVPGSTNFVCSTQTSAGSYADKSSGSSITLPTTTLADKIAACCDAAVCTAANCADGYTLKSSLPTLNAGQAPTQTLCCDATAAKCAGNAVAFNGAATAANDDDTAAGTVGLVDGFYFDCAGAETGTATTATTIEALSYTNKATGNTIALTACAGADCTDAEVDTAYVACCDAATCDGADITCPDNQVMKSGALEAGKAPTVALCCELPSTGYCTGLKDDSVAADDDTDPDVYACGADTYAVAITAATASCTGTATDTSKTCDLDATTDGAATCWAGCTEVNIGDDLACPEPPTATSENKDTTSGAAAAAPLAMSALIAALLA